VEAPPPERPPPPKLSDEPLENDEEAAEAPAPEAEDGGTELAALSPLNTIQRGTPPHVAAATRLADQARLRMVDGDADGAVELLERAVAVDPQNPYAYYFLAEANLQRGAYDQASTFAERAALLSARASNRWLCRSYGLQGRILEKAGAFTAARQAYQHALQADPRDAAAHAGLARVGNSGGAR
jgi:tetratricopeptide (TPR) repeat protein